MNNMRRKELDNLIFNLQSVTSKDDIQKCIDVLENIQFDEQDYYDNIPENLQYSERGCRAEEAIDNMSDALESLNDALDKDDEQEIEELIEDAIDCIENAQF